MGLAKKMAIQWMWNERCAEQQIHYRAVWQNSSHNIAFIGLMAFGSLKGLVDISIDNIFRVWFFQIWTNLFTIVQELDSSSSLLRSSRSCSLKSLRPFLKITKVFICKLPLDYTKEAFHVDSIASPPLNNLQTYIKMERPSPTQP